MLAPYYLIIGKINNVLYGEMLTGNQYAAQNGKPSKPCVEYKTVPCVSLDYAEYIFDYTSTELLENMIQSE